MPYPPDGRSGGTRRDGAWQHGRCTEHPRTCYDRTIQLAAAIARLKAHEAELKQLGVQHLYLFGSTARDEAREDSDVDLFFDDERGKLRLFELMDVKERTSEILGQNLPIIDQVCRQEWSAVQAPPDARLAT
jgi:uncharacterized protein